jgi:hypothetical protein
MMHCVYNVKLN